jgi:hypothetical protein
MENNRQLLSSNHFVPNTWIVWIHFEALAFQTIGELLIIQYRKTRYIRNCAPFFLPDFSYAYNRGKYENFYTVEKLGLLSFNPFLPRCPFGAP